MRAGWMIGCWRWPDAGTSGLEPELYQFEAYRYGPSTAPRARRRLSPARPRRDDPHRPAGPAPTGAQIAGSDPVPIPAHDGPRASADPRHRATVTAFPSPNHGDRRGQVPS